MPPDGYHSFLALATAEESRHYRIIKKERGTKILIFTPHGGGIEPGTSELVAALAGQDFSFYCFEGTKRDGNDGLHITSTHFDEPAGLRMARQAEKLVTLHGCGGRSEKVFIGGLDEALVERFIAAFLSAGFAAEKGRGRISGRSPRNICNQGKTGMGVQIEVSEGLRKQMFRGLDRESRKFTTQVFSHFVSAAREVLIEIHTENV